MTAYKPLVYIAGPMTSSGDRIRNIRNAIAIADSVLAMGAIPIVPHLSDFWELVSPKSYEVWMEMDFQMIRRSFAVFRMEGASKGADREVQFAQDLGTPVVETLGDLRAMLDDLVRDGKAIEEALRKP